MASDTALDGLLTADGALRILWSLALIVAIIFEIISFSLYNATAMWMRVSKYIESISAGVFVVWDIIYVASCGSMYHHFIKFSHVVDLLLTALLVAGSLFCLIGLHAYKKNFLYGQILVDVYALAEWALLLAHYTSDYTVPVERVSYLMVFTVQAINASMGSFLIKDLHSRMKNEEGIKRSYSFDTATKEGSIDHSAGFTGSINPTSSSVTSYGTTSNNDNSNNNNNSSKKDSLDSHSSEGNKESTGLMSGEEQQRNKVRNKKDVEVNNKMKKMFLKSFYQKM